MKLVRAKVKTPEHLPEWAKCCEASKRELSSYGELIVDLDEVLVIPGLCKYCNSSYGNPVRWVLVRTDTGDDIGFAPIALFDLDEGPLTPSQPTTTNNPKGE